MPPDTNPMMPPGSALHLEHDLGAGGMGQVWKAWDPHARIHVAIKFLGHERASLPRFLRAFRREIRAVARLAHPGIVNVFAHGQLEAALNPPEGAQLQAGSPYIVMELLSGGSLADLRQTLSGSRLKSLCEALLDALAHAHARNVIHRDIKPSNILFSKQGTPKLTDFGIAYHTAPLPEAENATPLGAGTPHYMAPEQHEGRWRDQGPWTDLYGLGCTLWSLCTGAPPFLGNDHITLRDAHLYQPLPTFSPHNPLPSGFEDWLRRLLAKSPSQRFSCAADAARALSSIEPTSLVASTPSPLPSTSAPATLTGIDTLPSRLTLTPDAPQPPPEPAPVSLATPWPHPTLQASLAPHTHAALSLFGLRPIPLVGRAREQDALWHALTSVVQSGDAMAVVLQGSSGVGKSALAQGLCVRARELGAAHTLEARFSLGSGGLSAMLRGYLSAENLPFHALALRAGRDLHTLGLEAPETARALASLAAPTAHEAMRFSSQTARFAIYHRWLTALSRRRPVILWLDDAQWSTDALLLTQHLLTHRKGLRLLIVTTLQQDAIPVHSTVSETLSSLFSQSQVMTIAPLPKSAWRDLVQAVLPVEPSLAAEVEARTAGNPLFAVQLIADWVQRGVLEATPRGFSTRDVEPPPLPDNLHAIWSHRIDGILANHSPAEKKSLMLGAALGHSFELEVFSDACSALHLELPVALLDALCELHLMTETRQGWSFAHGMLRESLLLRARDASLEAELHAACARALEKHHGPELDERLALHHLAAQEHESAIDALARAAHERLERGDARLADSLLERRESVCLHLGLSPDDPRWGHGWCLRARAERARQNSTAADRWAKRALEGAKRYAWPDTLAEAAQGLGRTAFMRGEFDKAEALLNLASAPSPQCSQRGMSACANAILLKAGLLRRRGRFESARTCALAAAHAFAEIGEVDGQAASLRSLAAMDLGQGKLDACEHTILEAKALCEAHNIPLERAGCLNILGEIARMRGLPEQAEAHYRDGLAIFQAMGRERPTMESNIGLAQLEQGRFEEAQRHLSRAEARFEKAADRHMLMCLAAYSLACSAGLKIMDEVDSRLESLTSQPEPRVVDVDIAMTLLRAGELLQAAEEHERATRCYQLVLQQGQALNRNDLIAKAAQALSP